MHCFQILALAIAIGAMVQPASAKQLTFTNHPDFFEKDPGGKPLGPCHGDVVFDKSGNIYFSTDTARGILVFSPKGKFIRSFGPTRIHGMELHKEKGVEYIYAARPSDHDVLKFKLDGTMVWTIHPPLESGKLKKADNFKPCAVTTGPDGSVYVADGYGSDYIYKFDKEQHFVKAFGGPGTNEGQFKTAHGITLDTRLKKPLLMVCNRAQNRVEYWDLDGNFVRVAQTDLRLPCKLRVAGDYIVIPELAGRVTVLDKKNDIAARVGDNPNTGQRSNYGLTPDKWVEGLINAAHGAAMDKHGDLIVTEWSAFGHLHKYDQVK